MSLTVLVTGATGFLGSHLLKALLNENHRVIILKRHFSQTKRVENFLSSCFCYDIDENKNSILKPFIDLGKIDIVVHTATCYGKKNEALCEIIKSNIIFPTQILEIASSFNTSVFINTDTFFNRKSTSYAYLGEYSLSKKHFLEWANLFSKANNIKLVNLKLEHVFGAGDEEDKFVNHIIRSCLCNVPKINLTDGNQKRDFIHIDDVVDIYKYIINHVINISSMNQEYSIGYGNSISIRKFVEMIHEFSNSKTKLQFGNLPTRKNEIMHSAANLDALRKIGFSDFSQSLERRIKQTINEERLILEAKSRI